ncbi:hypothetical protein HWV07_03705 [Natronomonas salina]|uniref:hypothetical protein n=1 Tax=Natronomonas salina TaxID=1710540 RepID=UPI0015B63680|nr:hypothetical protein [Natronomonas salina]QLD88186.1 hypothetical protein HWV07_03705 [Natronomonas salina]
MSVQDPDAPSVPTTDSPNVPRCASYMGCRHCEEGNLVYDHEVEASRCSSCGELD